MGCDKSYGLVGVEDEEIRCLLEFVQELEHHADVLGIEVVKVQLSFIQEKYLICNVVIEGKLMGYYIIKFIANIPLEHLMKLDVIVADAIVVRHVTLPNTINKKRIDFSLSSLDVFTN